MKRARVIIPTGAWDVTVTVIVAVTAMATISDVLVRVALFVTAVIAT